jgi:hypothetical protein
LGDGSSANFNVGVARWNGTSNAAGAGGLGYFAQGSVNVGGHFFYTGDAAAGSTTERMRIDSSGRVGIGTSSFVNANAKLVVSNGTVDIEHYTDTGFGVGYVGTRTNHDFGLLTNGTPKLYITTAGNVGIGTSSPTNVSGYTTLNVGAGSIGSIIKIDGSTAGHYHRILNNNGQLYIQADQGNTTGSSAIVFGVDATERMRIAASGATTVTANTTSDWALSVSNGTNSNAFGLYAPSTSGIPLRIDGGGSERMRIDSAGNLLVGKSAANFTVAGHELKPSSFAGFTRDGGSPVVVNRLSNDGDLIEFYRGATTVGSIGTYSGDLTIGNGSTVGLIFEQTGSDRISPWNLTTNATRDGEIDLGDSNQRFKDLYLSGGVYLGGTGVANRLDDYEEGTWTPTFANLTGVSSAEGSYVKIGNLVTVSVAITSSGTTVITLNSSRITNLPFTISTTGGGRYIGSFTDISASSGLYGTHTISGTTAIFTSSVSTGGIVAGSFTYRVA